MKNSKNETVCKKFLSSDCERMKQRVPPYRPVICEEAGGLYCTINLGSLHKKQIALLIPFGSEKAISRSALGRITGLCDRDVREAIQQARRKVAIIAKSSGGYYKPLASETNQLKKWIKQEEARAKEEVKRREAKAK